MFIRQSKMLESLFSGGFSKIILYLSPRDLKRMSLCSTRLYHAAAPYLYASLDILIDHEGPDKVSTSMMETLILSKQKYLLCTRLSQIRIRSASSIPVDWLNVLLDNLGLILGQMSPGQLRSFLWEFPVSEGCRSIKLMGDELRHLSLDGPYSPS